jgi:hypothetical protein
MEAPLVSIVTPSYNQGNFIRATIESVLSQDYPNLEYIIMDGGSTDQTASVVKDYASRLTFISEKDHGQSHAINKGFRIARGQILAWLNSDDLYLPGTVRKGVDALGRNPTAGAAYGEGYLIDRDGQNASRFPWTETFNLWKLVYLSDYILQQTVYFRKTVLEDVGYLDEQLHYTMDWDVLIRIAMKYPLVYVPQYLGCLREYPEAKSSAGGLNRIRELRAMLQRHTGMRLPPGYIVYGLDTYHKLWCERIDRLFAPRLRPVSHRLQWLVRIAAAVIMEHTVSESQGLYPDRWVARQLRFMLPPGRGPLLIEGSLPEEQALRGQRLDVAVNGRQVGAYEVPFGDFKLTVRLPPGLEGQLVHLRILASRWTMAEGLSPRSGRRRLAYKLKSIDWAESVPVK